MKISVIMPVHLGEYPGRAGDPEYKFRRAINTVIEQEFRDFEMIIVSDGCRIAEEIYKKEYKKFPLIRFKYIDKQSTFSGVVRQTGIKMAKGEIICYLDADDIFGKLHLKVIAANFDTSKYDWVYYNDYVINDIDFNYWTRENNGDYGRIGTSSLAHKRKIKAIWPNEYGHDYGFLQQFKHLPNTKIPTPQYYVCHINHYKTDY